MKFLNIISEEQIIYIVSALIVLGIIVEIIFVTGGAVLSFKEKHCYGRQTKKYLSEEYENLLQNAYPDWNINLEKKNIRKKELRQICVSCNQDLSQIPLYCAGTITKNFTKYSASVRMVAAVKPSYYERHENTADIYREVEYYTWILFSIKPYESVLLEKNGSFYAENFFPFSNVMNAFNAFKQQMSDKGKRKYDINAPICGGLVIENNIKIYYNGVKRGQWQNAENSGLFNEINNLYSIIGSKFRLDCENNTLTLAVCRKMTDNEMYSGHNDFPIADSDSINSAAEKICDIADIIKGTV